MIRNFGTDKFQKSLKTQLSDGSFLESKFLTKSLTAAQKTLEDQNFDMRKNVFDYDQILSKQRSVIFAERRNIIETPVIKRKVLSYGIQVINEIIDQYKIKDCEQINLICENLFGHSMDLNLYIETNSKISRNSLKLYLQQQLWISYECKEAELQNYDYGLLRQIEKATVLKYIDTIWKQHLITMSLLRDNVSWRGYGQRNPIDEYRIESFYIFKFIIKVTQRLIIYEFLHLKPI